jgi:hypothetical protein
MYRAVRCDSPLSPKEKYAVMIFSHEMILVRRSCVDVLANSASRGSLRKENSVSSNALKTSAGAMVFLPAATVFSLAL